MPASERILVIRLGALGDLILCFQAFHEIRAAHPGARIALLTMPPFAAFARTMPWFDEVLVDERPPALQLDAWWALRRKVREFGPTRVYDFQGKFRQDILYALLGGPLGPEWSGAAPFCKYPRPWPPQATMHYTDFVAAQLRRARVPALIGADLSWLDAPLDGFNLPERFAILIPSCAAGREYKRWPAAHYAALAGDLRTRGIISLAVGSRGDAASIAAITQRAPHVVDMGGKTSLHQLAALMRRSACVIGNDTGPTHLAGAVGVPTLALMSDRVNPVWSCPKGTRVKWLQGKPLSDLSVEAVWKALGSFALG